MNPNQVFNVKSIQKVQRWVTRIVPKLGDISCQAMLRTLDLSSLLYRRYKMDMAMDYKIIHGLDGSPWL